MAEAEEHLNNNHLTNANNYREVFPTDAITNITNGLVDSYKPPLEKTKKQLDELIEKQEVLIEQLHDENLKVSWTQNSVDLLKIFDIVSTYQTKLITIKKDMKQLHEKNQKLQKRATRLKQHKEKLDLIQNQQKVDLKKEQELIASTSHQ